MYESTFRRAQWQYMKKIRVYNLFEKLSYLGFMLLIHRIILLYISTSVSFSICFFAKTNRDSIWLFSINIFSIGEEKVVVKFKIDNTLFQSHSSVPAEMYIIIFRSRQKLKRNLKILTQYQNYRTTT